MIAPLLLLGAASPPLTFVPPEPAIGSPVLIYAHVRNPNVQQARVRAFGFETTMFRVDQERLRAVLAVPLHLEPKSYVVEVELPRLRSRLSSWLTVSDRHFRKSNLTVSKSFTAPKSEALMGKLKQELEEWNTMFEDIGPPLFHGSMVRPVKGSTTSVFGVRRIFNNKTKSTHYGLDLRGDVGDPIVSLQQGRVIMSKERWASGGTLVIDHGGGLVTAYFHMSRRLKKVGDWVEAGERLGDVGMSGRVTGPHLHLAVLIRMLELGEGGAPRVRNLYVDPGRLMRLRFEGSPKYLPSISGKTRDG